MLYTIEFDFVASSFDLRYTEIIFEDIDISSLSSREPDQKARIESKNMESSRVESRSTNYVCGKFIGNGIVKLFKDSAIENDDNDELYQHPQQLQEEDTTNILCILAVPTYLNITELLEFIGESNSKEITHLRLVRTGTGESRYMALMKFRDGKSASRFYVERNNKMFSKDGTGERCETVWVREIKGNVRSIPFLHDDPFVNPGSSIIPSQSAVELPICPVCLERMDSNVTGLLTIQCQHTFHCQCLSKWQDGSCPVCRYTQYNNSQFGYDIPLTVQGTSSAPRACSVCKIQKNLWICLVCGNLGCGRYDKAHAYEHHIHSGHCFVMDIETQRVWDYGNDTYVHRLIQNQVDGKVVELPGPQSSHGKSKSEKTLDDKKGKEGSSSIDYGDFEIDDFVADMVITQLESQREYYESLLSLTTQKLSGLQAKELRNKELSKELAQKEKDLERYHLKQSSLQQSFTELMKKYKEEKAINESTFEKLKKLQEEDLKKNSELDELRDTVRDLMFFHEAQEKLKDADEDIKEGQIIMKSQSESPNAEGSSSGKKKKKKKPNVNAILNKIQKQSEK